MCLFHLQHVCSVISPRFQYLNLMFSICNLKRGIRCAAMCSDFFYILSYRQRMCVCYAVYSNLYLVILGFDDKFSQSSRFCWQSNFSSIFKCGTSQFYLVPDVKNKIDLSRIFQALSSNWVPFFGGGRLEGTLRTYCLRVRDWRLFQGLGGGYFGQRKKWPWAGTRD